MRLLVTVAGDPGELEMHRNGDLCRFRYARGDAPAVEGEASVIEVEPGVYSVLWNGRSYEARVRDGVVELRGRRYAVQVIDPREMKPGAAAHAGGREELVATMPGKVVRLLVEEGAEVTAGQGIVVVEAMKMQNEMPAPRAGRVVLLQARAGETVAAGELLAAIE